MSNATYEPPMIAYAALNDFRAETFQRRVRRMVVRRFLWGLSGFVLLVVFAGSFQLFALSPASGLLGLLACVLCTTVAAECLRRARRERAMTIVNYCERGVRLSMPLPDFLYAVAQNESPRMARRLDGIVQTLRAPASLGGALRSELPELPSRFGDLIRVAETNGTLPATLSRLVNEERASERSLNADVPLSLAYLGIMIAGLLIPGLAVLVFVMPKLSQIYRDFGMKAPASWNWFYGVDSYTLVALIVGVSIVAIALVLGTLARNARFMYFGRLDYDRPFKPTIDRLLWHITILGWQIRDRDWADVCQSLAEGVAQHRPFEAIIREAASPHLNDVTHARLARWHLGIVRGESIVDSARKAMLPNVIVGLISGATSQGLAPTFAFLARHYRARAIQRGAWIAAALLPVLTLLAGSAVTMFALFLWVPLCKLIDATLPYPVGI